MTNLSHSVLMGIALVLGALTGLVDLRSKEVQLPALMLILSTVMLGGLNPKLAWLWALIVGLAIPTAHLLAYLVGYQLPYESWWLPTLVIPLVFALGSAYCGAFLRWIAASLSNQTQGG